MTTRYVSSFVVIAAIIFSLSAPSTDEARRNQVPDPTFERKLERLKTGKAKPDRPDEAMKWFYEQRAYPTGAIPLDWKERALAHIEQHNKPQQTGVSAISWTEVGPNNIGGRSRTLAVDPGNANIVYAGSVSGGVFKSTNAGTSWFPTNDFADNLSISSIAIDPTNTSIIYAGTGEGFFNLDAVRGAGMLKSTNGGSTWTLQTSFTGASFPYYINDIYLRPDSALVLYAATNTGLFKTTNGGTSWTFRHQGTSVRATQIVPNPTTPATFYVCYGNFSTDGIYKTTNGGTSFTKLTTGLPSSGYSRVSLAIAPSNTQILYAVFTNSSTNYTLGVYRTTDGGSNWSAVSTPTDPLTTASHLGGQGWYNNVIAVSPTDANTVYAGGVNLFKSTNGGTSWTMISNWYSGAGYPYVHADQHEIVFSGSTTYFCNDGGIFRSTNAGASFTEIVNGFATIQFYSGAIHPTLDVYYGGTQDNGTLKSGGLPNWSMVFGGDGGHVAVDFTTPNTVYTEYVYLNIQKSTNAGSTWTRSMNGIPTSGGGPYDGTSDRVLFIAPISMDPSNAQRLAAGTYRVFHTTDGAANWSAISSDLTGDGPGSVGSAGSTISAIAIAKTSSSIVYIGTSGSTTAASRIQVTTNLGSVWTNVTVSPLPNRYVTAIAIDPGNADRAWVTYSGYGGGHVFMTTNRGTSWTNASGNLPDIPANAVVINPSSQNNVIVGTDLGVFETTNGGTTWTQQNTGLANVVVSDLDLRSDRYLFAATHGRGMFKSSAPLVSVGESVPAIADEYLLRQNHPNPFNPATKVEFRLKNTGLVQLKVFDLLGREVSTLVNEVRAPGVYVETFDATGLASGMYICELRVGSFAASMKMVLAR
jgi:photosystem II stability/assembly factor-like uncharacterized protein